MLTTKSYYRKPFRLVWSFFMILNIQMTTSFYVGNEDATIRGFETPPLIQHPAGFDVRLKCGIRGNHGNDAEHSIWRFKACGEGYNKTSCRSLTSSSDTWQAINCDGRPCKATLLIKSPTENDSGLYRCSIFPYKTDNFTVLQIQIVKTYQLDVINFTIAPPEFLDDVARNTTAILDSQVVFQCKIHSKVPPSIKWFRKQDVTSNFKINPNVDKTEDDEYYHEHRAAIKYFENTYELLKSSGEKGLSEDTYLSKLIINNISEMDIGLYVCVGINYRGFKMREYYLSILHQETLTSQEPSSKSHLLLLFLIPISFVLITLLFLCCFKLICRKTQNEQFQKSNIIDNRVKTDIKNRVYRKDTKYAVVNINII